MQKLFLVGVFPPPMHGMAFVNAAVRDRLLARGVSPHVIDLAAASLDRSIVKRLARVPKVLHGLSRLVSARSFARSATLYMSVSGGYGQLYEILFASLGRLLGMRNFLHHHSYTYLDRSKWLSRALVGVAGKNATHITLSPGMASLLKRAYPGVFKTLAISNSAFLPMCPGETVNIKQSLGTIGFLSNISAEKGIFNFLEVAARLEAVGLCLRAKIAGPFQDDETERRVAGRIDGLRHVEYVGPKYGDDKVAFYGEIDALLFPTEYANESGPLTVHEAFAHAVPVIASNRGSLGEIITPECGLLVNSRTDFVEAAIAQLRTWHGSADALQEASKNARARFIAMKEENDPRWDALCRQLMEPNVDRNQGEAT